MYRLAAILAGALALTGCARLSDVGKAPAFTPNTGTNEQRAMSTVRLPEHLDAILPGDEASLWSRDRQSLLGDRRASTQGDILTVVIEIDDSGDSEGVEQR